jgi:hypothetical protein
MPERVAEYQGYAEECRKLAERMPEHKDQLLWLAEAWEEAAREASRPGRYRADPV